MITQSGLNSAMLTLKSVTMIKNSVRFFPSDFESVIA